VDSCLPRKPDDNQTENLNSAVASQRTRPVVSMPLGDTCEKPTLIVEPKLSFADDFLGVKAAHLAGC
jgi:hypothetical protein